MYSPVRSFFLCAVILLLFTLPAAAAEAEDVTILAQNYKATHDIQLDPISINASGLLTGLDYPGEWVEFHFNVRRFGTSTPALVIYGNLGVSYSMRMDLTPDSSVIKQTIDFQFVGAGYG